MAPIGFATFLPASAGADPCTGSNIEVRPGCRFAGRRQPQSALQRGAEIGDDVAEQVVGDDDVELRRALDHQQRERVDVEVARLDVG